MGLNQQPVFFQPQEPSLSATLRKALASPPPPPPLPTPHPRRPGPYRWPSVFHQSGPIGSSLTTFHHIGSNPVSLIHSSTHPLFYGEIYPPPFFWPKYFFGHSLPPPRSPDEAVRPRRRCRRSRRRTISSTASRPAGGRSSACGTTTPSSSSSAVASTTAPGAARIWSQHLTNPLT